MEFLSWGLWMTLAGMGSVFILLALLMGLLLAIGWFDQASMRRDEKKAAAVQVAEAAVGVAPAAPAVSRGGLSVEQLAAIAAAVAAHTAQPRFAQIPALPRVYEPGSQLYASRWVAVGRGNQNQSWRRGSWS